MLIADIAGYSRLLSRDEAGTIARTKAVFQDAILPLIRERGGQVVKTTGDGVLAEFGHPLPAVRCALEMQRQGAVREADNPADRRIETRIGISFGEVVADAGDLFGEQVAIAARLQKLAAPGGLCVTGAVFDRVAGHVDVDFKDAGEQHLRNLDRPVRVFSTGPHGLTPLRHPSGHAAHRVTLAVLPFDYAGGDPDREYFSDAIAEEIILALSRFRWFFVTARASSYSYRGRAVPLSQIAEELGVQYIVDGTVRHIGDRVRIAASLNDTASSRQIWSNRFTRASGDLLALLDEIPSEIVAAIEPEISEVELVRSLGKSPGQLDAWDLYHRASWHFHQTNRADNEAAKALFWEAIELDRGFARGHAGLAYAFFADAMFGYAANPADSVEQGLIHARDAVSLDPRDPFAHHALGRLYMVAGKHDASIDELTRALELNPNLALAHYGLGFTLILAGRAAEAIPHLERACRLSPRDPLLWIFFQVRALGHLLLGNLDEAVAWARRAQELSGGEFWTTFLLAAALGVRGDAEAGAVYAEGLARRPDFTAAMLDGIFHFARPADRERCLAGLAAAERLSRSGTA